MLKFNGQYGGEVLGNFTTVVKGERKRFKRGDYISPELAREWKPVNREALASTYKVKWYEVPMQEGEEAKATEEPVAEAPKTTEDFVKQTSKRTTAKKPTKSSAKTNTNK